MESRQACASSGWLLAAASASHIPTIPRKEPALWQIEIEWEARARETETTPLFLRGEEPKVQTAKQALRIETNLAKQSSFEVLARQKPLKKEISLATRSAPKA